MCPRISRIVNLILLLTLAGAILATALPTVGVARATAVAEGSSADNTTSGLFDPRRPPEAEFEVSMADGFTVATVGDCIISRPLSHRRSRDPDFDAVVRLLESADAAFGNLETSILEIRSFEGHPHSGAGDWGLTSLPSVAGDLSAMGFDLFSRANNHALDWGIEGMRETDRRLDAAGLVHAGTGEDRAAARAARYFESGRGRIGLVSMASTYGAHADALAPAHESPGRPGLSALRVKSFTIVPPDVMKSLAGIDRAMREARGEDMSDPDPAPAAGARESVPDELSLFGMEFRIGEEFAYRYEMNALDLAEILRGIRQGKQHSDFLIATIHAHQSSFDQYAPGGFLRELSRAAIDAGADLFIAHGIHHLGPIEVYGGKPIFYGLANFFWSDIQEPLAPDLYEAHRERIAEAFPDPAAATDADLTALLNATGFNDEEVFQTVVAVSRFEKRRLSEIRLHPVDLGYGRRLTESGIPRLASSRVGRTILERLRRISEKYGTRIAIEENVGVIRP